MDVVFWLQFKPYMNNLFTSIMNKPWGAYLLLLEHDQCFLCKRDVLTTTSFQGRGHLSNSRDPLSIAIVSVYHLKDYWYQQKLRNLRLAVETSAHQQFCFLIYLHSSICNQIGNWSREIKSLPYYWEVRFRGQPAAHHQY